MKTNNINEIWDGQRLIINDFTGYDLSNLDLSEIPASAWRGKVIKNTNFNNTNVDFLLSGLFNQPNTERYNIFGCCFNNCNLTRIILNEDQFVTLKFIDCDLRGSGLKEKAIIKESRYKPTRIGRDAACYVHFNNCLLPDDYLEPGEVLEDIKTNVDLKTVSSNPNLLLTSRSLYSLIRHRFGYRDNGLYPLDDIPKINKEMIDLIMRCDREGYLKKIIIFFAKYFDDFQMFNLIRGTITGYHFENINFEDIDEKALALITFTNCTFDNCTFEGPISLLFNNEKISFAGFYNCEMKNISFPQLNEGSWREIGNDRFLPSSITVRTNLYLELGRACNAKCVFCRNNSFDHCSYNREDLFQALTSVLPYVHDVVLGGGEPTLVPEDIETALDLVKKRDKGPNRYKKDIDTYVFTNGTADLNYYESLIDRGVGLNVSRHAVNDEENAAILGIKKAELVSEKKLVEYASGRMVTLCATCFKGGLDSTYKIIEYLIWAQKLGANRVLLSTLHKDISAGELVNYDRINIDEQIFNEIATYLMRLGYKKTEPIYSTGGYYTTVLENDSFSIILKTYVSKKELQAQWPIALKRTFDLSISPDGVLHENWHQRDDGLIIPKEKTVHTI